MKKTLTEAELRRLIAEGKSQTEIAALIGSKQTYVSATCRVLGITPANPKFIPKDYLNPTVYLSDMRLGMTVAEIAKKHGKTSNAIVQALKRAGLPTCAIKLLKYDAAQR